MTDTETFDLELKDATPEDFAVITGGISLMMVESIKALKQGAGTEPALEHQSALMERLLRENRDATRYMLLNADVNEYVHVAGELSDSLLDDLGLEQIGDGFVDAESLTDIDVE